MSTQAAFFCLQQKANLARIRDNQRRSRARRREYLQELEQRLRVYELQGVEASAEVQMAARRVAEENRQLRGLLNRHGIGDDYITSYLHSGTVAQPDPIPVSHYATANPGETVQSLQHIIAPRRPAAVDTNVHYPVGPQQGSREASIASVSTSSSSIWEPSQPMQPTYARGLPANVSLPVGRQAMYSQAPSHHYPQVNTISIIPRTEEYRATHPFAAMTEDPRHHAATPFPVVTLSTDVDSNMAYNPSMNPFHTQTGQDPGPPGC